MHKGGGDKLAKIAHRAQGIKEQGRVSNDTTFLPSHTPPPSRTHQTFTHSLITSSLSSLQWL